jgi:hypothetical protein
MAAERPPRLVDRHVFLTGKLCMQIEDERRRYPRVPSFGSEVHKLIEEAIAWRNSMRTRAERREHRRKHEPLAYRFDIRGLDD